MSCNDDLSQLMPSLYSRVKLTLSADDTAELVQYQEQQQTNSQQTDVPATSNMLEPYAVLARGIAVPEQVGGQQSLTQSGHKHAKGTGRTVARRPFDLQLRLPIGATQSAQHAVASRAAAPYATALMHVTPADPAQSSEDQQAQGHVDTQPAGAVLDLLQDISNKRHSQLRQHVGSGRAVTQRTFGIVMPVVPTALEPKSAAKAAHMTPHQAALPTPQARLSAASASKLADCSRVSNRSSSGTPKQGMLELPWRGSGQTPVLAASPAPSLAFSSTPMEGVPERAEPAFLQQTIRRQSCHGRLRTPASLQHTCRSRLQLAGAPDKSAQLISDPASALRPELLQRLQVPAADEAQPLEESPVVGLLEPQQQPAQQQQQQQQETTGAERYGSLGFFGCLDSAPAVARDTGAPAQTSLIAEDGDACSDVSGDMDDAAHDDFSDDGSDEMQPVSSAGLPPSRLQMASAGSAEGTPAAEQQAGRQVAPQPVQLTPGSSLRQQQQQQPLSFGRASLVGAQESPGPCFQEMEVQTGRSLQSSPALPAADSAMLAQQPEADQPDLSTDQEIEEQPAADAAQKVTRKSEAHQRLKQVNRQRRSLAGEGLHGERGVRRSSRDKRAPLEYWRNERKVYNREFRSLPTVHHYATRTPSPSWKFVPDLPHRKRSRLGPVKASEANV